VIDDVIVFGVGDDGGEKGKGCFSVTLGFSTSSSFTWFASVRKFWELVFDL